MSTLDERALVMRRFNRFYTRELGLLSDDVLGSSYSLTEARVLYEIANRDSVTAHTLSKDLGLDAGYLSRVIGRFEAAGMLRRAKSKEDRRQYLLGLTGAGQREFKRVDALSQREVSAKLAVLTPADQQMLVDALSLVETLLTSSPPPSKIVLRPHKPGDMGWVVERHGALYAREYGWDEQFEALVAEIAAKFIRDFDAKRERCWIAEKDGERVGSIFLVRKTDRVAKLRMLIVDPSARGHGVGRRLVRECVQFARHAGYRKVTLWTNSMLHAARHLYEEAGFQLVAEGEHEAFRKGETSQTWDLIL